MIATANTHRATCTACAAVLILRPAQGVDHQGRPTDAVATVYGGGAWTPRLPVLPALVWYTCPACDAWQRR